MPIRISTRRVDMNGVQMRWSKGADVASATTITLGSDGNYFDITGTTTIAGITAITEGTTVKLRFVSTPSLTNSASLILPSGADITAAAGDVVEFIQDDTSGNWRCTSYTRATGKALVSSYAGPSIAEVHATRGLSLADSTLSITGMGFQPDRILISMVVSSETDRGLIPLQMYDFSSSPAVIYHRDDVTNNWPGEVNGAGIYKLYFSSVSNYSTLTVTAQSDGVDIAFVKSGSAAGTAYISVWGWKD